jgi:uncharacterized protein
MADKVTWFEIPADDVSRANEFYSSVFGWSTADMGGGSLSAVTTPSDENLNPTELGGINGDISPRSEEFDRPLIIINVEDIDAKIEMVINAGGEIVKPRDEQPEMGIVWAIVRDTEGNKVGILQEL